jgi:hypothetical protein
MAHSDTSWTATVAKVLVECRASGGQGRIGQNFPAAGGGGGAGAYARKAGIVTIIGNPYLIRQGLGVNGDGDESFFINGATVRAEGGHAAPFEPTGGAPGLASNSVGDTTFDGGTGATTTFALAPGGGGGGGGGREAAGQAGAVPTGGTDGDGNGPSGGDGGAINANGVNGQSGGGGGGGGGTGGPGTSSGNGGDGWIVVYDDTSGNGWAGVLAGTSPAIHTVGSPPPLPPPPVTTRNAAFMM